MTQSIEPHSIRLRERTSYTPTRRSTRNGGSAPRDSQQLARALGWFSIGLGLTQLLAPRGLGRAIGVGQHPVLMPLLGLREIAAGVGILAQPIPTAGVRARVAGDLLDLGLLGAALATARRSERPRVIAATAAVVGVTALDVLCSAKLGRAAGKQTQSGAIALTQSIAINRPADELYSFCHKLENMPRVLSHLESVRSFEGGRSHWIARAPGQQVLEWDIEMITQDPNERLAWRSLEGAVVPHEGSLQFVPLPGGRGTLVKVNLQYSPTGRTLAAGIAKLFAVGPEHQLKNDLLRWKQLLETGEIPTTDGQPHGRRSLLSRHLP
jgi:uncharacterized membrane protein